MGDGDMTDTPQRRSYFLVWLIGVGARRIEFARAHDPMII